jgi:hypothetical protein
VTADGQHSRYMDAAALAGRALQARIGNIGRRRDSGEFTTRQAADERIRALEEHLATVRLLRERQLGGEEG